MKKTLALVMALTLALGALLPGLAEGVERPWFIPNTVAFYYNGLLQRVFHSLGAADPEGKAAQYMLGPCQELGTILLYTSKGGEVEFNGFYSGGSADASAPADTLTLTVTSAAEEGDFLPIAATLALAVSQLDASADFSTMLEWLNGLGEGGGTLRLDGCMLLCSRSDRGRGLMLMPGGSGGSGGDDGGDGADSVEGGAGGDVIEVPEPTEAPGATQPPASTGTAELPQCFIPQMAAQYFNGMLGPVLEMLGAPEPGDIAERFELTKAQIDGSVLYLSNAEGSLELSAYFEDGQPAVDRQATTLGIAMANTLDRSELLSVGATFSYMVMELDGSVEDFEPMLDWMSDAVDGGDAGVLPMNGYVLAYAKGENGHIFTLVPDGAGGDDRDTGAPAATEVPPPEPTEAPVPRTLEGAVLAWEGLSLAPAKYSVSAYSDGYASLKLYFRILNDTDNTFWVDVDGITIDGEGGAHSTSIGKAEPRYDSGEHTSDFALVTADTDDGLRAIVDARKVKLTVVLKDEHFDRVYSQDVTVDLNDLEGSRDVPEDFPEDPVGPTEAMHYSDEYKSQSSADYRTLCEGDTGEDVKRLQQALIDLGYLNDVADGEYGPKTAAAVQALNEANGLGSNRYADAVTQDLAFSGLANPYTEPWVPLIFQEGARGEWKNGSKNRLGFRVKVTNSSRSRTIKAFELTFYTTDVWGDKIYGDTLYVGTTTKKIKPGKSAFSEFFLLPDRDRISTIWCGVSKVIFTDGEVRENDDINYWSWSYK